MDLGKTFVRVTNWALRRDPSEVSAAPPVVELRGEPDQYDLGVLFVHGIGNQAQGQTLTEMGEPLISWLRRWALADRRDPDTGDARGRATPVRVRSANLSPPGSPAHAWVDLQMNGEPTTRWLLAEAWWAEEFRAASFGELFAWGLQAGPLALSGQLAMIWRRVLKSFQAVWRRSRLLGVGAGIAAAALFVGLALLTAFGAALLTIASLVLVVLAILPIPWLRSAVLRLQMGLANGLGDAYVLVNSPFRFTTMTRRFRIALEWLSPQCSQVVIVAHSQGAMVAYEGLRDYRPPNVRRFVTFGQAIMKLKLLRSVHEKGVTFGGAGYWIVTIVSVGALLAALSVFPVIACDVVNCGVLPRPHLDDILAGIVGLKDTHEGRVFLLSLGSLGGLQFLLHRMSMGGDTSVRSEIKREIDDWGLSRGSFDWIDLYATADPVPNGHLIDDPNPETAFASFWVRNRGSTVTDHTTYWSASTDFVTRVAMAIAPIGGISLIGDHDSAHVSSAIDLRDRRVSLLAGARVIAIVTWLALLLGIGLALPAVGQAIAEGPVAAVFAPAGDWLSKSPSWVRGTVAAAAIGIGFLVWYGVIALVWQSVTSNDARRFFRRDEARWSTIPYYLFLVTVVAVIGVGSALVDVITERDRVGWYLGSLLAGVLLFVYFLRLDKSESVTSSHLEKQSETPPLKGMRR